MAQYTHLFKGQPKVDQPYDKCENCGLDLHWSENWLDTEEDFEALRGGDLKSLVGSMFVVCDSLKS